MSSKTEVKSKKSKKESAPKESSLYFFYTQGCGWCKRVIPHIDALIEEGYDILKLDLADGENSNLQNEIKTEYKHQCGTPYFVDAETGNSICGYREKDVLEKWANGEEIPAPPRPKSPMPRPPFESSSKKEEKTWKKDYEKWADENSHLPNLQPVENIINNFKQRRDNMQQPPVQSPPVQNQQVLTDRIDTLEQKLDKLMKHLGVQ